MLKHKAVYLLVALMFAATAAQAQVKTQLGGTGARQAAGAAGSILVSDGDVFLSNQTPTLTGTLTITNGGADLTTGTADDTTLEVTGHSDADNGICTDLDGTVASSPCDTSASTRALCEARGTGPATPECLWNSTDILIVESSLTTCSGTPTSGLHADCNSGSAVGACSQCSSRVGCNSIVGCVWDADLMIVDGNGIEFNGISSIDFGGITEFLVGAGVEFNAGEATGVELPQVTGAVVPSAYEQGTVLLVPSDEKDCVYDGAGTIFNLCVVHDLDGNSTNQVDLLGGDGNTATIDDYKCLHIDSPAAAQTFKSVWVAPVAGTIEDIYCETNGSSGPLATVNFFKEDGSTQDMLLTECTCQYGTSVVLCDNFDATSTPDENVFSAGDRLTVSDLTITQGLVSSVTICWRWRR